MDLSSVEKIFYGPSPSQYFVLSMPDTTPADREAAIPVAVIIHGGFWKQKYTIENAAIENLAPFFLRRGISTCVLEYRRVPDRASAQVCDSDAGGWPASNEDVFLAMSKLSSVCIAGGCSRPCVDKVFFVGHSAGGYLALWSCLSGNIGRLPFTPLCCVALAPVCDLLGAAERRLSDDGDAVQNFMGVQLDQNNTSSVAAYIAACPRHQLPLGSIPVLLVAGTSDIDVPFDLVEKFYMDAIEFKVGYVQLIKIADADHYDLVNAASSAWAEVCRAVSTMQPVLELC